MVKALEAIAAGLYGRREYIPENQQLYEPMDWQIAQAALNTLVSSQCKLYVSYTGNTPPGECIVKEAVTTGDPVFQSPRRYYSCSACWARWFVANGLKKPLQDPNKSCEHSNPICEKCLKRLGEEAGDTNES